MTPKPKSLILDLLSTVGEHAMPVRALVASGDVFGITPESIRVALVRLLEQGTIERNERGQYRISAAAHAVQRHVVAWHRIDEKLAPWRGGWVGVHSAGSKRTNRAALRRRERALLFLGLRELDGGLWLRPDNLRGGVDAVRRELLDLGLDQEAPVFGMSHLDAALDTRARRLWNTSELRRGYRETRVRLERSAARLPQMPPREAMAESFLLGGEAIRQIVLDPLLPEPIVPAGERAELIATMERYDRLGRDRWRPFMREHGAPHPRTPLDPQAHRPPLGGTAATMGG